MVADLTDENFDKNPNAVFVIGMYSDPWMHEFAGVGYSLAPFSMKAIRIDSVIYIPDPLYAHKTRKSERDYANYPIVRARIQPPATMVRSATL